MSIRLLARDLYRLIRECERLERRLEDALPERKPEIQNRLRKARAERDRIRGALDGAKEQ